MKHLTDQDTFDILVDLIERRLKSRARGRRLSRVQLEVMALCGAADSMEEQSRGGNPDYFLDAPSELAPLVSSFLKVRR